MYRICCLIAAFSLGTVLAVNLGVWQANPPRRGPTADAGSKTAQSKLAQGKPESAAVGLPEQQQPGEGPGSVLLPILDAPALADVGELAIEPQLGDSPFGDSPSSEPTLVEPELEAIVDVEPAPPVDVDPAPPLEADVASGPTVHTVRKPIAEPELYWHEDYEQAWNEAKEDGRMLFIYFHDLQKTAARRSFETYTLADNEMKAKLADYVLLKLPVDATIMSGGQALRLLAHPSFSEMLGRQGVAIIDLAHRKTDFYGYVVSTFPFTRGKYYRGAALGSILTLPPGTLTQRTMIYAVRTHPEAPASTQGSFHNVLAEEAKQHSKYQADILVQGHHNWENRFHRINARLPGGVLAQEVVAESWPNESLVDACVDCVDSWRQSPGHWNAVRSRHPLFGFDIKRGRNGIWYATGIFGKR